ncbi:MAG: hypothetical protein ACKO96_43815 [Flammeovirgaceae bacterium]
MFGFINHIYFDFVELLAIKNEPFLQIGRISNRIYQEGESYIPNAIDFRRRLKVPNKLLKEINAKVNQRNIKTTTNAMMGNILREWLISNAEKLNEISGYRPMELK